MTAPLFDRETLTRQRRRAAAAPAMYLQEAAARDVQERLELVNRSFKAAAVVTPWPDLWARLLPQARIVADNDVLDLVPGAHDLVIHALCLHWAEDPVGQIVQCRHALQPDGLFVATLFGGQTLQELRRALAMAESDVSGGLSPRIAPMGEIRDLGGLLQRAGLALPVADSDSRRVSHASAFALMQDLRAMGEGNALAGRIRHPTRRAVLLRAATIMADHFADTENRIVSTFETITLTGWAPSARQPKALRPGSASHRLAAALGTHERGAGESSLDPLDD